MYNITFSINTEVCGQFIYEFCFYMLLKLALTVVTNVFCDVNCVKCKKYYASFQFSDTLKSSKRI